jgi:hypothetical protein
MAAGKGVIHGGGSVVHGVGHGLGTVGHGLGNVGGFAGRRIGLIKKRDKSGKEVLVPADEQGGEVVNGFEESGIATPMIGTNGGGYEMNGQSSNLGASAFITTEAGAGPSEPGILGVTVFGAKDLKGGQKPYVQVKVGGKTHKTVHVKGVEPEW